MTSQINVKFQDNFYNAVLTVSKRDGYMSVQEFIRGVVREYIGDKLTEKEREKVNSIYAKNEASKSWVSEEKVFAALKTD